jgi:phosphotransferase system enzyme I (PtsI)
VGSAPGDPLPADEAAGPGTTADGRAVPLLANLGRPDDVGAAIAAGAEGVGLFRTESLFLGRAAAPPEEVQGIAYRRVFSAMGERPVVVRIADLGGDRLVPYLSGAPEVNPGLGVRGIRLARSDRWLHLAQLRAIARAAVEEGVAARVMAPMVATLADVDLFRDMCDEAWSQAAPGSGRPMIGAMVEVPAAALMADALAWRVDYLSIGTNDLTQYALAADRGVAALASLQDALNPAVLRLVRMTVEAGAAAGIPVGACGVVAGEPDGALVLAGLGVGSLSMEPASIGRVRAALRVARTPDLRALAEAALRAPDAATVRGLAAEVRRVSSSRP